MHKIFLIFCILFTFIFGKNLIDKDLIKDPGLEKTLLGDGIGTSATRAEIIKKLNRINYIDTNNKTSHKNG